MAQYQVKDIKKQNPTLWKSLNSTLSFFPFKVELDEQDTNSGGYLKGGFSVVSKFKNGASVADQDRVTDYHTSTIPILIDRILTEFKSIAEYISFTHNERLNSKPFNHIDGNEELETELTRFDRVPIGTLELPPVKASPPIIEAYIRRRTIFSLLEICLIIGSECFWSNKKLIRRLSSKPQTKNSNFLKALRVEPCLLQTEFGIAIIKNFTLWNRVDTDSIGTALKPQKNAKFKNQLSATKADSFASKAILILTAIHPQLKKLKNRELAMLLSEHPNKYISPKADLDSLRQLRKKLLN